MSLGVLCLLLVPLGLARDSKIAEQNCMDDDLAIGRAGEFVNYQGNALPHGLDGCALFHGRGGSERVLLVAGNVRNVGANHQAAGLFL